MLFNAVTALLFAAAARAISITSPTNTSTWTEGVAQTITWNSVSTDPSTFTIEIRIPNSASIQTETIATDVQTSAGSYSYTPTVSGSGYSIRFLGTDSNNSGMLAESGDFTIAAGSGSATTSATSAGSSASTATTKSATTSSGAVIATSTQTATIPNASGNGASALAPSLALVGGSLLALML